MTDKNIKKVIISPSELLAINVEDPSKSTYLVRYRIVSEDKTRVSAWSPKYEINARTIPTILGSTTVPYNVFSNGDRITLTWTTPDIVKINSFDVYVSWSTDNSTWTNDVTYPQNTQNSSFSIAIPSGKKYVKFWVQAETYPKTKSSAAKLFETTSQSTAYIISGGTP